MGSKREEERNEKIIRGLMKLPPNRRCINCNSLAPQYVCTNFWTFVCTTCSGIHREFTHRVKSVSMAKFTSQEVDALQKGGNQRARELFLAAWDPQRQRLPDNSNADKVREFIKSVYVDKRYAVDKSSDRPPRDPQSTRSHEDEMRRASSYHSYSQSPPYDFQYEERRYGKQGHSLTRPGSDRGFYEGRFSGFLSPSHSDHGNDVRFANEGSFPRASDYSVSSGGDPFRSGVQSPSSQRDVGSPFSETSSYVSSEIPGRHSVQHNSDANSRTNGGRMRHPQRTESSGSFGSFDSMSFKTVNSTSLPEVASELEQAVETSRDKTSSLPSVPQSSSSTPFNGLDLFSEPFAPQNVTPTPTAISNSQLPEPSLVQSVDLFQQSPAPSVPTFSEQLNLTGLSQQQSVASSNDKTSDVVMPENGGWATFDIPQNSVPVGAEKSNPATVSSFDGDKPGIYDPFPLDQSSQNSASHEPSASIHTLWHGGLQNVESTTNNTQFWNAFDDSLGLQPIQDMPKVSDQAVSDANKSLAFGAYEAPHDDGNVGTANEIEPPFSSFSSHFNVGLHDFSMVPAVARVQPLATDHKPTNPFDLPGDAGLESSSMTQFWDMSSLREALPNNQTPASYVGDANESWFPQNSVPSYGPGGVTFDPPSGSLGFIAGQAPTQISSVPRQGSVASVGGNPFA